MSAAAVFVPAWAKINLTLSVLGKRPDGYHALASVMQTISLCDTLRIKTTADDGVICAVDVTELDTDDNLVVKAARLLQADEQFTGGVSIELHKAIPSPGGLGGGSSDAAAVLMALARLRGLELPQSRLDGLGARLGSDVPFFMHGGTALVKGRGEFVTPLPDVEPLWLVIARPPVSISTAAVFRALTTDDYGATLDTDAVVAAIRGGMPLPFDRLSNTLEQTVLRRWPPVAATRDALLSAGAPVVRMSGSGPTLFAPFVSLKDAAQVYESSRQADIETWLCHTVSHSQVVGALPAVPRT